MFCIGLHQRIILTEPPIDTILSWDTNAKHGGLSVPPSGFDLRCDNEKAYLLGLEREQSCICFISKKAGIIIDHVVKWMQ